MGVGEPVAAAMDTAIALVEELVDEFPKGKELS
jgi:hypothetical protein